MTGEQRGRERYTLWTPAQVEVEDGEVGVGVSRNISERGILLCTPGRLAIGASVTVTFKASAEDPERTVDGVIVRCEENVENPTGLWPYKIAVQFDDAVEGVVAFLREVDEG